MTLNAELAPFGRGGLGLHGVSGGNVYYLDVANGKPGNYGTTPAEPVSTLAKAYALASADQNDVIMFQSSDNTASGTTVYLSEKFTWTKDCLHLVGSNSGGRFGQRSRIAQLATATGVSPLIDFQGNNCLVENIHIFHGVADATSKIALTVSGSRNHFKNCHIAGIGNATQDVADAMDMYLTGSENLFENCVFGIDTIGRSGAGDAQYGLRVAGARNTFLNCLFVCLAEADTYSFIYSASGDVDRWVAFESCKFRNAVASTGVAIAQVFDYTGGGSPSGYVDLDNSRCVGATDWATGGSSYIYINGAAPTADTSGIALAVT